jgi:hypothetical protein
MHQHRAANVVSASKFDTEIERCMFTPAQMRALRLIHRAEVDSVELNLFYQYVCLEEEELFAKQKRDFGCERQNPMCPELYDRQAHRDWRKPELVREALLGLYLFSEKKEYLDTTSNLYIRVPRLEGEIRRYMQREHLSLIGSRIHGFVIRQYCNKFNLPDLLEDMVEGLRP